MSTPRTVGLAALGGALEFFDFVVFVYFAGVIGTVFFPPGTSPWLRDLQTMGIFAAGYLVRPVGGIWMAHHGDRHGRKRMFTLSVLLMAAPTLLIGCLPTYAQIGVLAPVALLVLRMVQGAAIGGEVPGAWVFVAEHVAPVRLGLACGLLTGGLTLGILAGSLVALFLNRNLDAAALQAWGWRVPFLLGGLGGLVAMRLRLWLAETPLFQALAQARREAVRLPLRELLATQRVPVLRGALLTWVLTGVIVVLVLLTPNLMRSLFHQSPADALALGSTLTAALMLGCVLAGGLADRFGVRRVFAGLMLACGGLAEGLYHLAALPGSAVPLALVMVTGLAAGAVALVPVLMVRSFPTHLRFTGLGVAYNVAYAIAGGLTPPWILAASRGTPLMPAHYVAGLALLACAVVLATPARAVAHLRAGGG